MKQLNQGKPVYLAAAHAGMDVKTARKWAASSLRPSEAKPSHDWRTREDPFAEVWDGLAEMLGNNPGLEAKTLFEYLQREHPGRFSDSQLRTLQRRVKVWRAEHGPPHEVYFPQEHRPGELCASDFTHMSSLRITIARLPFSHLLYHFVLTYSNWETVRICFSESLEALSEGLQQALFELGGVPQAHRTDRLSSAVVNWSRSVIEAMPTKEQARADFTANYERLLSYYGLRPERTQAGHGNENGDAEQRHHRLKRAVEQALLLRGSRDFEDRADYEAFLRQLLQQLNSGRNARLREEVPRLAPLPARPLDALRRLDVRVGPSSTIFVLCNVYSVPSRLIGEWVQARIGAETIDLFYGAHRVEQLPRLRGRGQHRIEYRHIIDWLIKKPGAFANYKYRADLFPCSRFRMAYDALLEQAPARATREYLALLHLAAKQSETGVQEAIDWLLSTGTPIDSRSVEARMQSCQPCRPVTQVHIDAVDVAAYDALLCDREAQS